MHAIQFNLTLYVSVGSIVNCLCVVTGRKEILETLLEAGMDPDCFDGTTGSVCVCVCVCVCACVRVCVCVCVCERETLQ